MQKLIKLVLSLCFAAALITMFQEATTSTHVPCRLSAGVPCCDTYAPLRCEQHCWGARSVPCLNEFAPRPGLHAVQVAAARDELHDQLLHGFHFRLAALLQLGLRNDTKLVAVLCTQVLCNGNVS